MKLAEIYQPLNEYIVTGTVKPIGTTYVYLYDTKYALQSPVEIDSVVYFSFDPAVVNKIITILANSDDFVDTYNSHVPIIQPHLESLKKKIVQSASITKEYPDEVKKVFLEVLAARPASQIVSGVMTNIIYGARIQNRADAQKMLQTDPSALTGQAKVELTTPTVVVSGPSSYIEVDHDKKEFRPVDNSARYSTRMGTYNRNSKKAYILVHGDFSIDPKSFTKLLGDLKRLYPDYEVAEFAGKKEILSAKQKMQRILSGKGPVVAYHGTSNALYQRIRKNKKMIPGLGPDYSDKVEGHSDKMIYFSLDPNVARRYGIRASGTRPYVILEVTIDDLSKIRFDEDSLGKAISGFLRSNRKPDIAVKKLIPEEYLHDSYHLFDVVRRLIRTGEELFPGAEKVVNYIKYRAVTTMAELSFAYEGIIPISKIKVYEKAKTKAYSDTTTSADDYADVAKAAASGRE